MSFNGDFICKENRRDVIQAIHKIPRTVVQQDLAVWVLFICLPQDLLVDVVEGPTFESAQTLSSGRLRRLCPAWV